MAGLGIEKGEAGKVKDLLMVEYFGDDEEKNPTNKKGGDLVSFKIFIEEEEEELDLLFAAMRKRLAEKTTIPPAGDHDR